MTVKYVTLLYQYQHLWTMMITQLNENTNLIGQVQDQLRLGTDKTDPKLTAGLNMVKRKKIREKKYLTVIGTK